MPKIIFFFLMALIFCRKYPIYENIEKSKRGKKKIIDIVNSEDYIDYVKTNKYVFSYFHSDWCDECEEFLPLLDEASTYKILNKRWVFLKVDCGRNNHVCMYLGVEQYPTSEIYVNNEQVNVELPKDLVPLLELLYKLSTDPIVIINSKEEFFKKYGYYSPIVEIEKKEVKEKKEEKEEKEKIVKKNKTEEEDDDDDDEDDEKNNTEKNNNEKNAENEENNEGENEEDFLSCITKVAKTNFIQTFYFGITEAQDYKEKIVFDNDGYPVTYLWDGVCQNAIDFLNENKYPLLSKVDKYLLTELDDESRILISLVTFPDNEKIDKFIYSMYKILAYDYKKYCFGYVNYTESPEVFDYYAKIQLNNSNEIQLIMNNFEDRSFYLHTSIFNIENQTEKEIYDEIKLLVSNITGLNFITNSKFQDFINFIGLNKMDMTRQIIFIIVLIIICLGCVYCFGNPEDLDDELYEYEDVDTDDGKAKSN
jgi:hypothetical protein